MDYLGCTAVGSFCLIQAAIFCVEGAMLYLLIAMVPLKPTGNAVLAHCYGAIEINKHQDQVTWL